MQCLSEKALKMSVRAYMYILPEELSYLPDCGLEGDIAYKDLRAGLFPLCLLLTRHYCRPIQNKQIQKNYKILTYL